MEKFKDIKNVIHDTKFKYAWKLVIVLTLLVITCSCSWINELGHDLDKMAEGREKFGTISLSHPILVESKKDVSSPFDFTLTTGPDDYYKDARNIVQGKMASSSQFVKDSGVDLSIQGDISGLAADTAELKQHEEKQAAVPESPAYTAAQPFNDPTLPSKDGSQNMNGFIGLLAGTPDMKISNRSAINTAAGDTVTEAIFTLLGNPAKTAQFKDKIMFFGVSMVSINPGYVTKEGYTGELSIVCSYRYRRARIELLEKIKKVEESKKDVDRDEDLLNLIEAVLKATKTTERICAKELKIPKRHQRIYQDCHMPLAAAVSPMTDVDALDLSSSIQNQTFSAMKISAALSYAGLTSQAEVFEKWARKLEQDTQTRTSFAAVTSFSEGRHFGFRIRPRLKAVKDETSIFKTPGYVLEDQAFPMAVIVGFDVEDLKICFEFTDNDELWAYEPMIEFLQTTNWLPNKEVSLWDIVNGSCLWNKLNGNELTETKRLQWGASFIKKGKKTEAILNTLDINDYREDFLRNYIGERKDLLFSQILGTSSTQYLPMEFLVEKQPPEVDDPNFVFYSWYDAPSTYVIKGKNFEGQIVGANIGGQPCKVEVVGDNTALITFLGLPDPSRAAAQADLKIEQANLNITKIKKRIDEAQNRINEANDIFKKKPTDPAAIEKKKKANTDLTTAKSDLAIAEANKKVAEKEKILAQTSILPPESKLDIVLITRTKEGPIPAGAVRFTHNVTPKPSIDSKSTSSSSGISKTDTTLTITRNAANKILSISAKGDSNEVDKLIDIVKEGEKAGANVDLKFNASGQIDVKADTKPK